MLPQNAIHRIFRDSEGYVWYGTFNGLCRSDGYNLKVFRSDFNNPGLLESNYITYITEDTEGKIWFGTLQGCYTLDRKDLSIKRVQTPEEVTDNNVFTVTALSDGSVWVSYHGHLVKHDTQGNIVRDYPIKYNGCVYMVTRNSEGKILISVTGQGMYLLDPATDNFEPYFFDHRYGDIEKIIYDERSQCYWLGTWGQGVVRFDPNAKNPEEIYSLQGPMRNKRGKAIYDTYHMVLDDINQYLWLTTTDDLYAFEIGADRKLRQLDLSDLLPDNSKFLYEIYKDEDGRMWVSSFESDSFIIDPRQESKTEYPLAQLMTTLNYGPAINSFATTGNTLWLIQERYGLCAYDLETGRFNPIADPEFRWRHGLGNNNKILRHNDGESVWAWNTWEGRMSRLKMKGDDVDLIEEFFLNDLGVTRVFTTLATRDNKLWIGTDVGLFCYDTDKANIYLNKISLDQAEQRYLKTISKVVGTDSQVNSITSTSDGRIWAATADGHVIGIKESQIDIDIPLDKPLNDLANTSDGQLIVGTDEGDILSIELDQDSWNITDHSSLCGMNGDQVNSLLVDNYNHLWIVTNNQIKEYNPRNGAYRTFSVTNPDFPLTRIIAAPRINDKNGQILFGGMGGLVGFQPSQRLESIPQHIKTHISDIKVLGSSVIGNSFGNSLYDEKGKGQIVLEPDATNITIEFSTLDFSSIDNTRYAYRLEGVDKDWVVLGPGSNTAFYNKIGSGWHTFYVKATDNNGLWSDEVTEIRIHRKPLWHETWWFKVLIVLAIAALAVMIVKYLMDRAVRLDQQKFLDSEELMRLREYIENNKSSGNEEFVKIDTMLLESIRKTIEENISDPNFDVNALAEKMHMSRSTLSRKIKAIMGQTPLDYIKNIKLERAAQMLQNRSASVADVIDSLGYSDYKNFSVIFKKKYGVTPSEYRRRFDQNN